MAKSKLLELSTQFTYGFEIEGQFAIGVPGLLLAVDSSIDVEEKSDGSVHVRGMDSLPDTVERLFREVEDGYEDDNGDYIEGDSEPVDELAIGVFGSYDTFLKALKVFKHGKNYAQNTTCGLHVHIKPLHDSEHLRAMVFSYSFLSRMNKWCKANLCECNRIRLSRVQYVEPYKTLDRAFYDIRQNQKYRFISNHPSGTIEFRLFSPCEHMVGNVARFFEQFFIQLAQEKPVVSSRVSLMLRHKKESGAVEIGHKVKKSQSTVLLLSDADIEGDYYFERYRAMNDLSREIRRHRIDMSELRPIPLIEMTFNVNPEMQVFEQRGSLYQDGLARRRETARRQWSGRYSEALTQAFQGYSSIYGLQDNVIRRAVNSLDDQSAQITTRREPLDSLGMLVEDIEVE